MRIECSAERGLERTLAHVAGVLEWRADGPKLALLKAFEHLYPKIKVAPFGEIELLSDRGSCEPGPRLWCVTQVFKNSPEMSLSQWNPQAHTLAAYGDDEPLANKIGFGRPQRE